VAKRRRDGRGGGTVSIKATLSAVSCIALGACGTINVAFDRFNTITTTAIGRETTFLQQSAAANCRTELFERVLQNAANGKELDIKKPCQAFVDPANLKLYDDLLKGVVAYTGALQAEVASGSTKTLDDASKNAATQFGAAAKAGGSIAALGPGGPLTTAADSIVSWALGKVTYDNAQAAVKAQHQNLVLIVSKLQELNSGVAAQLVIDRNNNVSGAQAMVQSLPDNIPVSPQGPPAGTAPSYAIAVSPGVKFFLKSEIMILEGVDNDPATVSALDANALNKALDGIVKCSHSIGYTDKRQHPEVGCEAAGSAAAAASM